MTDYPQTKIMGILNVTPDSFFDQGRYQDKDEAYQRALAMITEGADMLDIGGESTRPGSEPVNEQEELTRVIPVITKLRKHSSLPISIDTTKPKVAQKALESGATLLNDVTGFSHPEMIEIALSCEADLCVMHMLGTPKTMQQNPFYEKGIIPELLNWFEERINFLIRKGIQPSRLILDPGIGFGKTVHDNLLIIHNLKSFKALGFRILLGVSRKSFMSKITGSPPEELLSATLGMNTIAMLAGVDIIRVHDIKEHRILTHIIHKYMNT